jgi:hypothetical protein
MTISTVDPGRWLLRCPVDDSTVAPGATQCLDCGVSVEPLRAMASTAGMLLQTAATVDVELASRNVGYASALVPESENFLLDAGRCLIAAGALEAARNALERAALIAPGRKDIKAELSALPHWTSRAVERAGGPSEPPAAGELEPIPPLVASEPLSRRAELMVEHGEARRQRDQSELGSAAWRAACLEVARIEIAIAALTAATGSIHGAVVSARLG